MKPSPITLPIRPKGLSFRVENLAAPQLAVDEAKATISIFDAIRAGETLPRIAAALRQIGARPVVVEINSPGGDYFEGVAVYNALLRHQPGVVVQVLGIAASAASLIAMAGSQIQLTPTSTIFVHNSRGVAVGDRHTLRTFADVLEQLDRALVAAYSQRTGLDPVEIAGLLDEETFLDADKSVALGFADTVLDRDGLPRPETVATSAPQSRRDLETALREQLGFSKSQAVKIAGGGLPALHAPVAPDLDTDRLAALVADQTRHWLERN